MHRIKHNAAPNVFKNVFTINTNKYNTKSANSTFYKPFFRSRCNQFSILFRGPHLWNSLVPPELQDLPYNSFKNKIKIIMLNLTKEETYF